MRKIILFLTPLLVLTILFLLIVLVVNRDGGKGALQVTSIPQSQVFVDGKFVGKTPLCLCDLNQLLKVGDYDIRLVPVESGFKESNQKIKIYQGVLTVVDRTFDQELAASSGSLITLSPTDSDNAELMVVSVPNNAQIVMDSNPVGNTPLLLKDVTDSDHEIKLIKDGYKEKIIKVKAVKGKRLEAVISLGIRSDINSRDDNAASKSAVLVKKVIIKDTPTGFLRVRETDSVSSSQVGTVEPGEELDLLQEKEEWFEIKMTDGKTGWISSDFAEIKN